MTLRAYEDGHHTTERRAKVATVGQTLDSVTAVTSSGTALRFPLASLRGASAMDLDEFLSSLIKSRDFLLKLPDPSSDGPQLQLGGSQGFV